MATIAGIRFRTYGKCALRWRSARTGAAEDRCGRSVVSGATLSAATAILRGSRDRYDVQAIHDPECSKPIRVFARSIANNGRNREPTILFAHLLSLAPKADRA